MRNSSRWRLRAPRSTHLRARFRPEFLEARQLLSTATLGTIVATPAMSVSPDGRSGQSATPLSTQSQPLPASALTATQVRSAYGINQLTQTGAGETIAIVVAFGAPNIASDLNTFDSTMGLSSYGQASQFLSVVNQNGGSALPAADSEWALETSLDVEWAHAVAPGAKILLVEASSANLNDLVTAIQYASGHANVVSMSWGTDEFAGETAYDSIFLKPGVTFVASSGDSGGITGPEWPSVSPNVLAVGGTTLSTTSNGTYQGETAWSGYWSAGSGGGVSEFESLPTYQSSTLGQSATGRTTPDVAFDANPSTGFAVYDSTPYQGQLGWFQVGGTSAGAPQWAALIALADQGRVANKQTQLNSQGVLTELYGLAYTLYQKSPSTVFHDITSGYNSADSARPGYDQVTGLGSPRANVLVPSLVAGRLVTPSAPTPLAAQPSTTSAVATAAPRDQLAPPTVVVVVSVPAANSTAAQPVILFIPVALPALPPVSAQASNTGPVTSSALEPQAPSSAPARPVQPLTLSKGIGDRLTTVAESALEEIQAPVPDVILEHDTPPPPPAPRPDEAAPAVPSSLLRSWDYAVKAHVAEAEEMALPWNPPPPLAVGEEQPASALGATLSAGAAVALWGTWEVRSRLSDRRRHQVLLPEGPSIN